MTIEIPASRQTIPLFFEVDGKRFVRFILGSNHARKIELPEGAKIIGTEELARGPQ